MPRITKEAYLEGITEEYKSKLSRIWFVHFPGNANADEIYFTRPSTLEEAIDYVLHWLGEEDLPIGTEFWRG